MKELKQVRGLFAYYAKWIADFSTKIRPLIDTEMFPLSTSARRAFEILTKDLREVTLMSIDEDQSFVVKTDASNVAISVTINQNGKPVAFFSRPFDKPSTAIKIYHELLATFGTPNTIHSHRGSGFRSTTMRKYLSNMGINMSTMTLYHLQGNGQCKQSNGTIWRIVRPLLHLHNSDISHGKKMLPTALHSIRSLLNTSTNYTPNERFFNIQRRPGSF